MLFNGMIIMLINFVQAEICKFKGTKTFFILFIGAIIIPVLMAIINFFSPSAPNAFASSLNSTVTFVLSFLLLIFGALMINSLFSIDLRCDTLKSIIPLPVSVSEYLNGKLATLLVWMIVFSLFSWIFSVVLFAVIGMGFDFSVAIKVLGEFILGSILIFLIMTPVVFVYVLTKNQSITLIVTIILMLFPILVMFGGMEFEFLNSVANYVPWAFVSNLVTGVPLGISKVTAYIVIIVTFIVGYIASHLCLSRLYID